MTGYTVSITKLLIMWLNMHMNYVKIHKHKILIIPQTKKSSMLWRLLVINLTTWCRWEILLWWSLSITWIIIMLKIKDWSRMMKTSHCLFYLGCCLSQSCNWFWTFSVNKIKTGRSCCVLENWYSTKHYCIWPLKLLLHKR